MEIRKLEAFCKVVELKSFTRAGEQLLLSQPTVSEHVRSLELELEHKLLDRMGRTIEVTPVGELLYRYANKILRIRHEAIQAVQQYGGTLGGRIVIGSGTIPGTYILPALMGKFRKRYPAIKTTLRISSSLIISEKVLAGELELGLVGARWEQKGLDCRELFPDKLTLVLTPDHPWASQKEVSLKDLLQEPFIFREVGSGTRKAFARVLETQGFRESDLHEVAEIGSTAAIKEAVKAGVGISVLSRCAVRQDVECGRLCMVGITGQDLTRSFYLIQRHNRSISPAATEFHRYLCRAAAQWQQGVSRDTLLPSLPIG